MRWISIRNTIWRTRWIHWNWWTISSWSSSRSFSLFKMSIKRRAKRLVDIFRSIIELNTYAGSCNLPQKSTIKVSSGTWYLILFTVTSSNSSIRGASLLGTIITSPLLYWPGCCTTIVWVCFNCLVLGWERKIVVKEGKKN